MAIRHYNSDGWSFEPPTHNSQKSDLTGKKFTRLTVIRFYGVKQQGSAKIEMTYWLCRCDCGNERIIPRSRLRNGSSKSCGCYSQENLIRRNTTHGYCIGGKFPPEYITWEQCRQRTMNPTNPAYYRYGAIGRIMCQAVKESFPYFLSVVGHKPFPKAQLDRINNDKGYSCGLCNDCKNNNWPMNMRWVTAMENSNNRRDNRLITFNGQTKCITAWARDMNLPHQTLWRRIKDGWDIEIAITKPPKKYRKLK